MMLVSLTHVKIMVCASTEAENTTAVVKQVIQEISVKHVSTYQTVYIPDGIETSVKTLNQINIINVFPTSTRQTSAKFSQ